MTYPDGLHFFHSHLPLLEQIFGSAKVSARKDRLQEIYVKTEEFWYRNLDRYGSSVVKYLLIAEAPPWSEENPPRYFYSSMNSNYHSRIWRAFSRNSIPEDEDAYQFLADQGFLLIDSIPYSLKYDSKHRKHRVYQEIVDLYMEVWLAKLQNPSVRIHQDLKIALGFKLNGEAIIRATEGTLDIANQRFHVSSEHIAADGSGYTNSEKLKGIFGI